MIICLYMYTYTHSQYVQALYTHYQGPSVSLISRTYMLVPTDYSKMHIRTHYTLYM